MNLPAVIRVGGRTSEEEEGPQSAVSRATEVFVSMNESEERLSFTLIFQHVPLRDESAAHWTVTTSLCEDVLP
ncbi:hypothetical protein GN956_G1914 [Arapaima gigas]